MELVAQYTFMITVSVIGFLVVTLVGILSWIFNKALRDTSDQLKGLKHSDDRLSTQIAEMRSEFPEKYVLKSDSMMFREEIRQTLQGLADMIREEFKDMRDRIDGKADK